MTTYKTLNGTTGAYGHGDYAGHMPHGKRPGKWLPKVRPVLCLSGYHVCRDLGEVLEHAGRDLYEVEVRGECDEGVDKAAWEQMRILRRVPEWNDRILRMFAVDCARNVAHTVPPDERALYHAVLDICVACAEYGDEWAAARDAAWDAAWAAAREDAAWAAAWDAAWAAAREDAAWAAARAATWAAARNAAWDAARAAQVALLRRYLDGEVGPLVEETATALSSRSPESPA